MSSIDTEYLLKCLKTVETSYNLLMSEAEGSILYEVYRNSLVKTFEITLEMSGRLLKKRLEPFFASKAESDRLAFKDIFRTALKHSLLDEEEVERWFVYRDNRNNTAHDYGEKLAKETLVLIDSFIADAKHLKAIIDEYSG